MTDADEESGRPRLADLRDTETVYQPAEDSRLLAETALDHATVGPSDWVLDVGTGSGYVGARIQEATEARVVGIDINPEACTQAHRAGVRAVRGDVLAPIQSGSIGLLVCNPPYLPTPPEAEWDDWMEQALSGGEDGRRIVNRVLADARRVLAPDGTALVLLSSLTEPGVVRARATREGFEVRVIAEESHPFERLVVLELVVSA